MTFYVDITTLGLACLVAFAYLFRRYVQKNRELPKQPPGPPGLPVFGHILFIRNEPHVKLTQLKEKYGDIYSLKLGSRHVVVLNSEQTLREASFRPEFSGRPKLSDLAIAPVDSPLFGDGKVWSEHRKFTFKVFRELETGSSMEENIKKGERIHVRVIWRKRRKLRPSAHHEATRVPDFKGCDHNDRHTLRRRKVKEHRETFIKGSSRDFLDYYLCELLSKESSQNTTFDESLINDTVLILYLAGSDTVITTLEWCVYIMAAYPEVQEKVQKEIDDIVGQDRTPSLTDQKSLPYTQAVLMEIQRWRTFFPLNPKKTLKDCGIGGYHIPKDTAVLLNSWAVHHDPRYWEKPDDFIPERFLSSDGSSVLTDNKSYIPFGVGKRCCPGERIGVTQVFLYFTTILQNFKLKFAEGHTPDLTPIVMFTTLPKEQEVCFVRRVT